MIRLNSRLVTGSILFALSLWSAQAFGQTMPSPGNLADITGATPPDDWSIAAWKMMFGDFVANPFAPGAPDTLMGQMFLSINAAIFTIGFTWAMYSVLSGVVQTAHEGEVLGKRMSTVWFPIRMIVGISGMVPAFKGFTLFQAAMMFLITVGIGLGNTVWTATVNATSDLQALVNKNNFTPSAATEIRSAARTLFLSEVCMLSEQQSAASHEPPLQANQVVAVIPYGDDDYDRARKEGGFRFGTKDRPTTCGFIGLKANSRSRSAVTGFRVESVNYDGIAETAKQAYVNQIPVLEARIRTVAQTWLAQRDARRAEGGDAPPFPIKEIDAAADDFKNGTQSAIVNAAKSAQNGISDAAKSNMLKVGWSGAGAWFSTFAEVNAAVADASRGPAVHAAPPSLAFSQVHESTLFAVNAASESLEVALKSENASSSTGDHTGAIVDSALKDTCTIAGVDASGSMGTATGNCSLGQAVVSAAIRGAAVGSGGGGDAEGHFGFDKQGLVNPIIMSKNMGDWMMTFSSTIIGADVFGPMLARIVPGGAVASNALGAMKSVGDKVGGAGAVAGAWETMKLIAMVFLVAGAFLSIYIPLVPFIIWMGSLVAYVGSVFEGVVGASMHSVSHLASEGEGLGEQTRHGYIFFVNVLLRPALMIAGFFGASAILIMVGTLQAWMFLPAMANAQGNSMTGVASILAYILVFAVINVTLISSAFQLINVVTDQVLGFMGANSIASHLGRETDGKTHQVFMMAGGSAAHAVRQLDALKGQLAKKGGEDAGGAATGSRPTGKR